MFLSGIQTCVFLLSCIGPFPLAQAQADEFRLPAPGVRVALSPEFNPPILKGLKVHPDNPFRFDFILDQGDSLPKHMSSPNVLIGDPQQEQLKQESTRLIKYFLASLTIPEKDLWVNLSPYEKNRIVPESFGQTEMGRDLLAEDYMLKQITASLIYPEGETGRRFWKRIYEEASRKFGTTNIPVNTFNKVWIVPEKAVVYENAKAGTAYVVESKLKVMLEQDYLSMQKHSVVRETLSSSETSEKRQGSLLAKNVLQEIVIPQLTKEVNEGKNFTQLRQVYNSLILATWYKKKIKDSILSQVYADKNKIKGLSSPNVLVGDPAKGDVEAIYQRYLKAFKKGAYNYIKEEIDLVTQETIPRKYFSGGVVFNIKQMSFTGVLPSSLSDHNDLAMSVDMKPLSDAAMAGQNNEGEQSKRRWWQKIIGEIRASQAKPLSKGGIQVDRRTVLRLMSGAAAAAGVNASGLQTILGASQGPLTLPTTTYVDLIMTNTEFKGFSFLRHFFETVANLSQETYQPNSDIFDIFHHSLPATLAELWEESGIEKFETLPTSEQLKQLSDFFANDPDNSHFERFSRNPFINDSVSLELHASGRSYTTPTQEDLRFFFKFLGNMIESDYKAMEDLLSLIKRYKKDPQFSKFVYLFEDFLMHGKSVLENSVLFQDFLRDFFEPARQIGSDWEWGSIYDDRVKIGVQEGKQIEFIMRWLEQLRKWAEEYSREHPEETKYKNIVLSSLIAQISVRTPLKLVIRRTGSLIEAYLLPKSVRPFPLRDEYVRELLAMIPANQQLTEGQFEQIVFDRPMNNQQVDYVLRKALSGDAAMKGEDRARQGLTRRRLMQTAFGAAAVPKGLMGQAARGLIGSTASPAEFVNFVLDDPIDFVMDLDLFMDYIDWLKNPLPPLNPYEDFIKDLPAIMSYSLDDFDGEIVNNLHPNKEQLKALINGLESQPEMSFKKFSENKRVQEFALLRAKHDVQEKGLNWGQWSDMDKNQMLSERIQEFYHDIIETFKNAYILTDDFSVLVESVRANPALSRFADSFEKYLEGKFSEAKSDPVFQDYIKRFGRPLFEARFDIASREKIAEEWQVQKEKWAGIQKRAHTNFGENCFTTFRSIALIDIAREIACQSV